jgi:ferredoxin-type protein NapH
MVALVFLNLYEKKAGQLGAEEEINDSAVLSFYDHLLGGENKPMLFRGNFEGGLWSFRMFGLSMSDPLSFLVSTISARDVSITLLLSILIPLVLLVVFGRSFCAWICPYSLLAEAGQGITRMLKNLGVEYFQYDLPSKTPLLFLILSLIAGATLSFPAASLIYPPRIITAGVYHLVITGSITAGLVFLASLWVSEIVFSPHLFCRRLCPGGALFSLIGRLRLLRIRKKVKACDMCGVCNPACPYDLKPARGSLGGECDNCGLCMDACHGNDRNALDYIWSLPSR